MSRLSDYDGLAERLSRSSVLYYGVGHVLNDITAACWFTYLLLFLTEIGMSPRDSAVVMLTGQVADAFATIFAGEMIDRNGHFKAWHGAGSLLVALSFSSVFGGCLPCTIFHSFSSIVKTLSYSFSAAIFNIGWAITQVSHMSMLNCLSLNSTSRVSMAGCRNTFTMIANLSLYGIAFIVFNVTADDNQSDVEKQYRWIAYVSIFVGCCFIGVFYMGTKEPRFKGDLVKDGHGGIPKAYWFRKSLYYQVGLVYMLTRLVQNVSQAYIAFYVIDDLRLRQSAKAVVPAIMYISSFAVSVFMQEMEWSGRLLKVYYTIGGILWMVCGGAILFLPRDLSGFMYAISVCIGIANAFMVVTGVSMQSFLIGSDLNGCAFVCGSYSFLDKMSCGIALYVFQSLQDSYPVGQGSLSDISVTRYGLGLFPAVCSLIGVLITYIMVIEPESKPLMIPLLD